jgi:hypothetical protein
MVGSWWCLVWFLVVPSRCHRYMLKSRRNSNYPVGGFQTPYKPGMILPETLDETPDNTCVVLRGMFLSPKCKTPTREGKKGKKKKKKKEKKKEGKSKAQRKIPDVSFFTPREIYTLCLPRDMIRSAENKGQSHLLILHPLHPLMFSGPPIANLCQGSLEFVAVAILLPCSPPPRTE